MNQFSGQSLESINYWLPEELKKQARKLQSNMSVDSAVSTIKKFRDLIVVEDMPRLVESYQRTLPRTLSGVNIEFINNLQDFERVFGQIQVPTLILTDNKILDGSVGVYLQRVAEKINPDIHHLMSISSDQDFPFESLIDSGLFLPRNYPQEPKLISNQNLIDIASVLQAKEQLG